MAEESKSSYGVLFQNLKDRDLSTPKIIISDAHSGLVSAIRESFLGASWQRCKVHFMRNILVYVPQKEKKSFAEALKEIWLAPTAELARKRAYEVIDFYAKRFRKRFSASKPDWRILWPSTHSPCWTREKSHLPT